MSISLYDASVLSYLQTVRAVSKTLTLAEQAASENTLNLESTLNFQLKDDMLPFSFQVISVWHHSLGALKGMKAGLFEPPPKVADITWVKLRDLLTEAEDYLLVHAPMIDQTLPKFRISERTLQVGSNIGNVKWIEESLI